MRKRSSMEVLLRCLWIVGGLMLGVQNQTRAQFGSSDLGQPAVSTLTWKQIATTGVGAAAAATIGLTTDGKVYVWGRNSFSEIHTNKLLGRVPYTVQSTPYYRSMPNGLPVTKVAVSTNFNSQAFVALSQDGTLYGWGVNPKGLFGNAWVISTTDVSDTTRIKRIPQVITLPGETKVLDFALFGANGSPALMMIGGSGKAYLLGYTPTGTGYTSTPIQIPFPVGVTSYKRVWFNQTLSPMLAFLLGNDDKLYATGQYGFNTNSGTLELSDPQNTLSTSAYDFSTRVPKVVPLPAGVVAKELSIGSRTTFLLSTTGQAFAAGIWYSTAAPYNVPLGGVRGIYAFPLKNVPTISSTASTTTTYVSDVYRYINSPDTTLFTNKFLEVALPPGAQSFKFIDVGYTGDGFPSINFIDNNNKVYWKGRSGNEYNFQNHLQFVDRNSFYCESTYDYATKSPYTFEAEAVNLRGAVFVHHTHATGFVISGSGKGYVYGALGTGNNQAVSGLGKGYGGGAGGYPTLIASEQLDLCNSSPGTGGGGTSGPAVGTIDCSKTQIVAAPVAGTPGQHTLVVTVNVTTVGSFSPLSVSGSGMSLANGVTSVTTANTGVQELQIPINYDGTALTNNFQFTIGQAGSCTANLTLQSNPVLKNVFTLQNCTAITPGTLSK